MRNADDDELSSLLCDTEAMRVCVLVRASICFRSNSQFSARNRTRTFDTQYTRCCGRRQRQRRSAVYSNQNRTSPESHTRRFYIFVFGCCCSRCLMCLCYNIVTQTARTSRPHARALNVRIASTHKPQVVTIIASRTHAIQYRIIVRIIARLPPAPYARSLGGP